jgi:UDP-N-acetylmuramoyl-tripeptide--D-alanyl-D-alanine ligase
MVHGLCLRQLAETIGGQLQLGSMPPLGGDLEPVGRVVTDVRHVRPGDVYWALETSSYNVAARAEEAFAQAAAGAVVSGRRLEPWAGTFSLVVEDPPWALWQLARRIRAEFTGHMIAVTGGLGKTTTRRMIEAVLATQLQGWSPERAANDRLGWPLSLLELGEEHDFCVVEYGAPEPGEISALSHLCDPQVVVINSLTNQRTGTLDEPARTCEAELLEALPEDGWAVLNGDVRRLREFGEQTDAQVVLVGRGSHCDVTASQIRRRSGELSFTIAGTPFRVPVWGRHSLHSALAAYAVGRILEIPPQAMAAALGRFRMPPQRCELTQLAEVLPDEAQALTV